MAATHHAGLTIEDIVAQVEAKPGTSLGIPKESLLNTWNCASETIAEALINHKSIIVPHFAHFIVQKQQESSGTWGVKTSYIPSVVFLSAFTDSYGIRKVPAMRQAHIGASVPVTINMSVVSGKAGLPRHAAGNSIRDIVRQVGSNVSAGKAVRLNMGFAEIHFAADGSYAVRWEEEFAKGFSSRYVPCAPAGGGVGGHAGAACGAANRPSSAKALPSSARLGRFPAPPAQAVPPAGDAPGTSQRPGTARIPVPPRLTPDNLQKATGEAPGRGPTPVNNRPGSARSDRSVSSHRSSRSGRGTPRRDTNPASNPLPVSASPGMSPRRQMDIKEALDKLKSTENISRYQRQKTRKTLYRQARNKAYEESWENQAAIKRQILEEERLHDKEKVAQFKKFIADEHQRHTSEVRERRTEDKQVQQMNLQLATVREKLAMPRAVSPGDIFNARQPTYAAGADHRYLQQQIEQQHARRAAEREEDKRFGDRAAKVAEEWKAKEYAESQERKRRQQVMREEYEAQIAKRRADEQTYKQTLTNGGALLFSGDDGSKQEQEDHRRVLERTRIVQEANKAVATERSQREKAEFEKRRQDLMESQAERRRMDLMLKNQNQRVKDAIQANLRNTWDSQINEKAGERRAYQEAMKQWKEHNYLKNESSDDDE